MILTEEQECMLSNHIKALERLYGFSVNQSCELAHECTAQNKPAIPVSWKKYRIAGDPNTVLDSTSKKAQHLPNDFYISVIINLVLRQGLAGLLPQEKLSDNKKSKGSINCWRTAA